MGFLIGLTIGLIAGAVGHKFITPAINRFLGLFTR